MPVADVNNTITLPSGWPSSVTTPLTGARSGVPGDFRLHADVVATNTAHHTIRQPRVGGQRRL
jgi:hypothetical protein